MYNQLSLFETHQKTVTTSFYKQIQDAGFNYQEIDIGDITFKGGQKESIHRWYRLTPSYAPSLVRHFIDELGINSSHFLVDPFSGRGTTIIECQKKGIQALGIEINPLLQEVGNRSLIWDKNNLELLTEYQKEIQISIKKYFQSSIDFILAEFKTNIPIIHNVFRWWKKDVLKNLIICRQVMNQDKYIPIKSYLWLAINKASLDCANIHRNHPTITFDDNHQREINVYQEICDNLKIIQEDLVHLSQKQLNFSELNQIIVGNSVKSFLPNNYPKIDFIITSPPYPNRYSYVHQTRPQLYFMELLDNVTQATEIDLQAIGGTWGRATSVLKNGLILVPSEIKPYLDYYEQLKDKNQLMCNYATKYFIDLWQHIKVLKNVVSHNFRGAYIVGNSRLSNVEIYTEVILGKLFNHEGFEIDQILHFRKRGGKKHLYETSVCIRN